MQWKLIDKEEVLVTKPFSVERLKLQDCASKKIVDSYYRIRSLDFVNVLAVTPKKQAVLIRQTRVGNMKETLETPGGLIEPGEEDREKAALRELEEETGYTSNNLLALGCSNPNPAIMNNKLYLFLALDAFVNRNRGHFPDENEVIEVELVDCSELEGKVRRGEIGNSLCALTIMLGLKFIT